MELGIEIGRKFLETNLQHTGKLIVACLTDRMEQTSFMIDNLPNIIMEKKESIGYTIIASKTIRDRGICALEDAEKRFMEIFEANGKEPQVNVYHLTLPTYGSGNPFPHFKNFIRDLRNTSAREYHKITNLFLVDAHHIHQSDLFMRDTVSECDRYYVDIPEGKHPIVGPYELLMIKDRGIDSQAPKLINLLNVYSGD